MHGAFIIALGFIRSEEPSIAAANPQQTIIIQSKKKKESISQRRNDFSKYNLQLLRSATLQHYRAQRKYSVQPPPR